MNMKKFKEDFLLSGLKPSDRLRGIWFAASMVALGSMGDAPLWVVLLLTVNFGASAINAGKIKYKDDGEEDI
jgi:hypothetical protein